MNKKQQKKMWAYVHSFLEEGQFDAGQIMLTHILRNDGIELLQALELYAQGGIEFRLWFPGLPKHLQALYETAWNEAAKKYDMPNLPCMTYGVVKAWR